MVKLSALFLENVDRIDRWQNAWTQGGAKWHSNQPQKHLVQVVQCTWTSIEANILRFLLIWYIEKSPMEMHVRNLYCLRKITVDRIKMFRLFTFLFCGLFCF